MPRFPLLLAAGMLVLAGTASASSFIGTTDTLGSALSKATRSTTNATSSLVNDKVVLAAREDAASFVGSAGDVRGARLEAALTHIRQQAPGLEATDLQLAEAILAL